MSQNPTPHLLWALPVSQIPLFLSLHAYTVLLPALHAFRLCHQYGYSTSTLLPAISRLPPSLISRIESHLIAACRLDVHARWLHRLETASLCSRCLAAPSTREDLLRREICHCRTVFKRDLELEVQKVFIEKGCGKDMWDVGDGRGKMTTGRFLRRFCGLELFVEAGETLWLCLPFCVDGGGGAEKGRLCVGRGYTLLGEDMVRRFRFAVETLGMEGERNVGERKLVHWRGREGSGGGDFGVRLMLFSAGFVVA